MERIHHLPECVREGAHFLHERFLRYFPTEQLKSLVTHMLQGAIGGVIVGGFSLGAVNNCENIPNRVEKAPEVDHGRISAQHRAILESSEVMLALTGIVGAVAGGVFLSKR